jgi:cullin-5
VSARIRVATSCSSSARSTAGVAPQPGAASRAPAIAASSCSGDAVPSSASVSSVAGFSTSSAGPSPATCSPRISSLVSMGADPNQSADPAYLGAERTPFLTESGSVKMSPILPS